MTDRKRRPMLTVLCEPAELRHWHALAKRRHFNLSTLVRLLLEEETKRQELEEERRIRLEKARPKAPQQTSIDDVIKGKAAAS